MNLNTYRELAWNWRDEIEAAVMLLDVWWKKNLILSNVIIIQS